ncbi:MAG: aminoglycoside phosphotransferase family protein [Caldilineaceae bacterium]
MLDIEQADQLLEYLTATKRIEAGERPLFRVLPGGVSNRTVWVERPNGETWVLKQALEKLRVKVDWFSSPERIHREALGMRWLLQLAPPGTITPLIFEDFDEHILAMQAVLMPHTNWKSMLLAGDLQLAHIIQFAELLGTVHRNAWQQRAQLETLFADRVFFESLRLEPYYAYTAWEVSEASSFLLALIEETRERRQSLVHGDYSPKNVLVYQDRLILLDHEVIHWGDPAFDLGFAMTHLFSKAHHLTRQRQAFGQAVLQFWRSYCAALGDTEWITDLEARAIRHTLGCLLARVAGRSPLEYLSEAERKRQQRATLNLIKHPPYSVIELMRSFLEALD